MKESNLSRRDFLKISLTSVAGLVINPEMISSLEDQNDAVRRFEEEAGYDPLTFEQAKSYVPILADHYAFMMTKITRAENKDPVDIAKDIYFFRFPEGYVLDRTRFVVDQDLLTQLHKDYPDLKFNSKDLSTFKSYAPLAFAWVDESNQIFIPFERINRVLEDPGGNFRMKFLGDSRPVNCDRKVSPAERLRSILIHELVHRESLQGWHNADPEFSDAVMATANLRTDIYNPVLVDNFMIKCSHHDGNDRNDWVKSDLNEFVTEFFTTVVANKAGLWYEVSNYGLPHDFSNFSSVLRQAGISYKDLYKWYKSGDLTSFYKKLASGARGITFLSDEEKVKFGLELLPPWSSPRGWAEVKKHPLQVQDLYPGVDRRLPKLNNAQVVEEGYVQWCKLSINSKNAR